MQAIQGLHHVTAVARDPQRNIDFYRSVLGQRFVKRTVNFDAPDTYHFYFGDHVGSPGSILTFFAWTNMPRGVRGNGETNALAYKVPKGSLEFWQEHLKKNNRKKDFRIRFPIHQERETFDSFNLCALSLDCAADWCQEI